MLNSDAFFLAFFLVNEIIDFGNVGITVEQKTVRGQAIASRACDFLIITFDAFRQIKVNDKAHIRFVDAHAERDGGNDDLHVVTDEGLLIFTPLGIFKSRVIRTNRISARSQIRGKFIDLFARETIDDAGPGRGICSLVAKICTAMQ